MVLRVTDLMSCLLDLGVRVEEKKVTTPNVANPSKPFKKWLESLDSELRSTNGKMVSLVPGPEFDLYLAQHLPECIGELRSELVDVTCGLSLLESDDATLSKRAVTIRNALSDSMLKLNRMQFD